MKSANINILQALSTLYTAGEITFEQIQEAINTPRGLNMPCGALRDEHAQFYNLFVATDKDDRTKALRSKDGERIKFNFRANNTQKKSTAAQTPGQVLAAGQQGAPQLDPATLQAIQGLLQAAGIQVAPEVATQAQQGLQKPAEAAAVTPPESDFGDLNDPPAE